MTRRPVLQQPDGRQGRADAGVVGDPLLILGHVEVDSDEHALPGVELAELR